MGERHHRRRLRLDLRTCSAVAYRIACDRGLHPRIRRRTFIARAWLAEKGYDRLFGARPLARVIQEHIKKPLAEELLFGQLAKGGIVRVTRKPDEDTLSFSYEERPAEPTPKVPELVE